MRKKKTNRALQCLKRFRERVTEFCFEPLCDAFDDGRLMPDEVGVFGAFYHHEFHIVAVCLQGVVHVFGLQGAHEWVVGAVQQKKGWLRAVDVIKGARVPRGSRGFL